jgi:hypothetical protein
MAYSQNDEEEVILKYFGEFKGKLIDIGCNDGMRFSNSARLIELGWSGKLFDADKGAAAAAEKRYKDNPLIDVYNYGLAKGVCDAVFYNCTDSLLSSTSTMPSKKWPFVFTKSNCKMIRYNNKWEADFITIDAEYMDWEILQTIDLTDTKCLCIEFGEYRNEITNYCNGFGMRILHKTPENLIFVK